MEGTYSNSSADWMHYTAFTIGSGRANESAGCRVRHPLITSVGSLNSECGTQCEPFELSTAGCFLGAR